jgi:sugar O-acyltransferase (sialic acid O-acetyltransferase NeuD family)
MTLKEIILIGAGGHAKSCIEIIESNGEYSIAHVVGRKSDLNREIHGHTVRHTDEDLVELSRKFKWAFIAIGQIRDPQPRMDLVESLSALGYQFPAILARTAQVSRTSKIGAGTIVMNGAIVNADCIIGANVIVNSGSIIEHDVVVGDNCHISTRVTLNGGVKVGQKTFVGSGTLVSNGIEIGENSFVGIGSVLKKSLPANSNYKEST